MNKLIIIILLLTSSLLSSQNFVGEKFRLLTDSGNSVITFENLNADKATYVGGQLVKSYGKLTLSNSQYKLFISNLKKISGEIDYEIVEDSYRLDKYSFDTESVFLQVGNKIGSITTKEIKKLRKL
tara:strand:+ start:431 stop:808 length:378 start_codon:yes stop_codon:yes gene_type:complete